MNLDLKELSELIESSFGEELLFGSIFGSRAREENRLNSDIDLLIVLKNTPNTSLVKSFREKFINFQLKYNITPDYEYPGEVISVWKLLKAIKGYGFVVEKDRTQIDLIHSDSWTLFNEYRQWLCAAAGPSVFLVGDHRQFEDFQEDALGTVLTLALLSTDKDVFESRDFKEILFKGDKQYLGFCNTLATHKYLDDKLLNIKTSLLEKSILKFKNDKFSLIRSIAVAMLPELTDNEEVKYKKNFIGHFSNDSDLKSLHECLKVGIDFIKNNDETIEYKTEQEIKSKFFENIPQKGEKLEIIIKEFNDNVLNGSIRQSSQNYLAFPDAGNSIAGLCADILLNFSNQNLIATTKSAPTATFVEIQLLKWIRKLIGFSDSIDFPENAAEVGGEIVTGGTMANTTALLVARSVAFPDSRKKGVSVDSIKPILIVAGPTMYHYSHIASFWWLGMGEENIVYVDTSQDYRFNCEDLNKKLIEYNNNITSKVVAVVCQAGDSRTTTIENFDKIADITDHHKVWLHVDACHGGVLIFSEKYREKLKGLNRADSVSLDPHKGLCLTYPSSLVMFKDVEKFKSIAKSTDITIQKDSYDLGQMTPFVGSRSFSSLKLWFLIKNLGLEGIDRLINYRFKLAEEWYKSINESSVFEPLNKVELNSVVFTVSNIKIKKLTQFSVDLDVKIIGIINKKIHDQVYEEGHLCIHSFDILDLKSDLVPKEINRVLGVTFGNPYTAKNDFPEHVAYLENIAIFIIKNILKK